MNQNKVVLLHDAFDFKGGGERLVKILCEELGLDLAFGKATDESYDLSVLSGQTIDLNAYSSIPIYRTLKQFQAFCINSRFIRNYETVIYSGQNSPLAVRNHLQGRNIYYCHTPPRSLYDLKTTHLANLSLARKQVHHIYNFFFQPLYESAIRKMDLVIANSDNIKCRIKKYLDLDAQVIYPPCETDIFQWLGQGDYYLSTARLLSYKRVDIIIKAFSKMPEKKLVITSSGPEVDNLKALATGKSNITFTGSICDKDLWHLMGNAIATIYIPKDEDFGMSPVESMAAGKPVIGVKEGGLLETVVNGETGLLLNPDPSPQDIIDLVKTFNAQEARSMRTACEIRSKIFRKENFIEKMKTILDQKPS